MILLRSIVGRRGKECDCSFDSGRWDSPCCDFVHTHRYRIPLFTQHRTHKRRSYTHTHTLPVSLPLFRTLFFISTVIPIVSLSLSLFIAQFARSAVLRTQSVRSVLSGLDLFSVFAWCGRRKRAWTFSVIRSLEITCGR